MADSDQPGGPLWPKRGRQEGGSPTGSQHAGDQPPSTSAPRPEAPDGVPSLDLLDGLDRDTEQAPGPSSPGSSPLDPHAFDPPSVEQTLRIDLARPAGLPMLDPPRPPPLPATKPARPLRLVHRHLDPEVQRVAPRTPVTDPASAPVDDVIFDIDVSDSRDRDDEALRGASSTKPPPTLSTSSPRNDGGPNSPIIGLPLPAPLPVGVSTRDILPPRPATESEPPLEVTLPCSVLVVDADRRAGAQSAARLMEVGYTCRVAPIEGVRAVLAQQAFDIALVDVPDEQMHRDYGATYVAMMAPWEGPIVLTTSTILGPTDEPMPPHVKAVVSKPLLPAELVRTLEAARAEDAADPSEVREPVSPSPPPRAEPDAPHPSDTLHPIHGLRLLLSRSDGRSQRGIVPMASYGGRLQLDLSEPLVAGATFDVEVILLDGRRSEIPAKGASVGDGVGLELELDPGDVVHYGRFLDEARDATLPPAEPLRARERAPVERAAALTGDLGQMWMSARAQLDDDVAQQAFIQACLRRQQMDFAIRCYRQLKDDYPTDERVAKYLNQVGTIVGFYALRKEPLAQDDGPRMSTGLKLALGLFLVGSFIFMALVFFMG